MPSLFIVFQHLVPQHFLSRVTGYAANSRLLSRPFIYFFRTYFKVDLTEAEFEDPKHYPTFNDFFTRALKSGARPIANNPGGIVSPADGAISQLGTINDDLIFQAKGHSYKTSDLLACSVDEAKAFTDGEFITVYLSPRDYHRVHMPVTGKLLHTTYVPGKLFSVNQKTAESVPNLFAVNERLVCIFDTEAGKMALVLVGALVVAGIETVWSGHVCPEKSSAQLVAKDYAEGEVSISIGDEMGRFKLGSTAIVLFEKNATKFEQGLEAGCSVKMGELIALQERTAK